MWLRRRNSTIPNCWSRRNTIAGSTSSRENRLSRHMMLNLPRTCASHMLMSQFPSRIRHTLKKRPILSITSVMSFLSTCQDLALWRCKSLKPITFWASWSKKCWDTQISILSSATSWRDGIYMKRSLSNCVIFTRSMEWAHRAESRPSLIWLRRRSGSILQHTLLHLLLLTNSSSESLCGRQMNASIRMWRWNLMISTCGQLSEQLSLKRLTPIGLADLSETSITGSSSQSTTLQSQKICTLTSSLFKFGIETSLDTTTW